MLVVSALVATGIFAGSAPAARVGPVPASFSSNAVGVCRDLKSSLSSLPSAVRRVANKIPGHATKAEVRFFGNYLAVHEVPAFQRAAARLKALGQPPTGRPVWSQFLLAFQSWVAANTAMTRQLQNGNDRVYFGSAAMDDRNRAYRSASTSAPRAGTTNCLAVIG